MLLSPLLPLLLVLAVPQAPACEDAVSCRAAALAAAAEENFEAFHDLAWRAVQRGRRNDPELMLLLARAQSLSGRPGDALVMLRRLTEMGVLTDAREHDDFRRVRALAGWSELEARMAALADGRAEEAPPVAAAPPPPPAALPAPAAASPPAAAARAPAPAADPATLPAPPAAPAAAVRPAVRGGETTMRLMTRTIDPVGLGYDSVSRRFVVGDRQANKVLIADEVFNHVNDLIGAAAGGFGGLSALAVDGRRGDLWVTSGGSGGDASIHKLQLVSGRLLATTRLPAELQPLTVRDLAVTDGGLLLLADAAGDRLLALHSAGGQLERPWTISVTGPQSVAAAGDAAYVAHGQGLGRVDLASGRLSPVRAQAGVNLSGLTRIRWYNGSLIALQQDGGTSRLVRIRLAANGATATALEPLDEHPGTDAGALTISRDAAYFLARADGEAVIRRVDLR